MVRDARKIFFIETIVIKTVNYYELCDVNSLKS